MNDGLVKVAAATPQIRVADCMHNAAEIIKLAKSACAQGARVVVFPELCITGYTCGDLFLQPTLQNAAADALLHIAQETKDEPALIVVGLPLARGAQLFNCAAVLYQGDILGVVPKTHLPNHGEFYERRHFSPAPAENTMVSIGRSAVPFGAKLLFCCRELPQLIVAAEICEDLWVPAPPSVGHACAGATVVLNLSASDELAGKNRFRKHRVVGHSAQLICAYLFADAGDGESTTDMVFAAHNLIAENGMLLAQSERFSDETLLISEVDVHDLANERQRVSTFPAQNDAGYTRIYFSMPLAHTALTRHVSAAPFYPSDERERARCFEDILRIQSHGLKKRLAHAGAKTAVIGISGGLDSALALLVCVRACDLLGRPRTDILAVTMPCFGTTSRTKSNAQALCEHFGVDFREVDITKAVQQHFADIGQDPAVHDVTFENAQARERTQVLMDLGNRTNGLVIGTGDLSEMALGWTTYNGDHMSMYAVNASVPKTLVRHLVAYETQHCGNPGACEVLTDILDTPVSPELLPPKDGEIAQKTEDLVGPYELHDFFLFLMVRRAYPPKKILRFAEYAFAGVYDRATILKWLRAFYRRFFSQQFKRSCMPDGPKVGPVSLSPRGDWRMPSDACAALWMNELDALSDTAE